MLVMITACMRKHGIKECNPTAATCILRAGRTAAADKSDMDMMQRQRVGWRMREQKAVDGWALPVLPVNCSCICCTVKLQSMWSSACWKNGKKFILSNHICPMSANHSLLYSFCYPIMRVATQWTGRSERNICWHQHNRASIGSLHCFPFQYQSNCYHGQRRLHNANRKFYIYHCVFAQDQNLPIIQ